jgi:DNA-directed RNA polymerase subunit K/omega
MNLKDDEILDDISESSNDNDDNDDDFDSGNENENDNEKNENDIDDLEEDKNDVDDDDSENESIYNDDDNDEDDDLKLSLIHKKKELNDDENDYVTDNDESDDDSDDDFEDNDCFQKLKTSIKTNLISEYHPELMEQNESEVELMSTVVRNSDGVIIDDLHRSLPFVTKYERARVIGERTRQINSGATPFIDVEPNIIDGYLIAINEFNKKKIPFIIKRPLPSGKCEYWKLSDLEIL